MPKVTITRKHVIVVDTVGENSYKDMTFKDKEGNDYKISNERVQYFEGKIVAGQAVQLNYAMSSFGKEFIYSAELIKDKLPSPVRVETVPVPGVEIPPQPPKPPPSPAPKPIAGQEEGMWWKHKAFSLSYAKDLACHGVIEVKDIYKYAGEMLDWLNKPMV